MKKKSENPPTETEKHYYNKFVYGSCFDDEEEQDIIKIINLHIIKISVIVFTIFFVCFMLILSGYIMGLK
jgi:hypothetical protein